MIVIPTDRYNYFRDLISDYKEMQEAFSGTEQHDRNAIQEDPGEKKTEEQRFEEAVKIFYELERRSLLENREERERIEAGFQKFVVDGETVAFPVQVNAQRDEQWTVYLFDIKGQKSGIKAV